MEKRKSKSQVDNLGILQWDTSTRSSRVLAIQWDPLTEVAGGILTITFKGNKQYQYLRVSRETAISLAESDSIGRHFDQEINKKYQFRKSGEDYFHD